MEKDLEELHHMARTRLVEVLLASRTNPKLALSFHMFLQGCGSIGRGISNEAGCPCNRIRKVLISEIGPCQAHLAEEEG